MLIYTLSNFYPHWYTLIPGSICLGLAFGPLWASLNVHITTVAIRFAPNLNETSSKFALVSSAITMCYLLYIGIDCSYLY